MASTVENCIARLRKRKTAPPPTRLALQIFKTYQILQTSSAYLSLWIVPLALLLDLGALYCLVDLWGLAFPVRHPGRPCPGVRDFHHLRDWSRLFLGGRYHLFDLFRLSARWDPGTRQSRSNHVFLVVHGCHWNRAVLGLRGVPGAGWYLGGPSFLIIIIIIIMIIIIIIIKTIVIIIIITIIIIIIVIITRGFSKIPTRAS